MCQKIKDFLWNRNNIMRLLAIILLFYLMYWPITIPKKTNLDSYPLYLKNNRIQEIQKEIEILSQFLIENARQIIWIRGVLITILIGIISYLLKEYYLSDSEIKKSGCEYENKKDTIKRYRGHISIILIILTLIAFSLESILEVEQIMLTNRVYQLDKASKVEILSSYTENMQDTFVPKNKLDTNLTTCEFFHYIIFNVIRAPTFLIFYCLILILIIPFPYIFR